MLEDLYFSALERADQKPGSYSGKLNFQLKPKKRSDASAKVILRYLFEIMKANEAGIKADIDTEFLHDYRIAIRRTRSALSQIRNVFPAEVTEYFKGEFRTLGQRTSDLRDLDVYLMSEDEFEARLPAAMHQDIVPLFEHLRLLREQALEEVREGLSSSEYAKVLGEWEAFLSKLDITFNRQRSRKQQLKEILDPFREEYDLIILDTPPTINILAENIFNAADDLLVPLIPSTLSIQTHAQLLSFLKKNKYRSNGVYSFFSFVDGRKKMHRELATWARGNFNGVLRSVIPYLSHVEQMGIYREPVPAFAPASRASKAYQELWEEIHQEILCERK